MSQLIPVQDAITMNSRYRQFKETILAPAYKNQDILSKCETFDKAYIEEIINQRDCVGLRIYYGMDTTYKVHAVLVGVDANDADMLPGGGNDKIAENSRRCPNDCPPPSVLNQ